MRLWERPVEELLVGELGTLPLAPLGPLPADAALQEGLASVIQRVIDRVLREAPPDQARRLLTSAFLLTGLRVPRDLAKLLFQGVRAMRDSDTYLAILEEGAAEGMVREAKKIILRQGTKRFGPPGEAVAAALTAITDLDRLERLSDGVLEVSSWQELLDLP